MNNQTSIFDAIEGGRLRDKAISDVEIGAGDEWMAEAQRLIVTVAQRLQVFTTDDVWAAGLSQPREPRALGAAMRNVQAMGIIEPTNLPHRLSKRKMCHRRPLRVWGVVK